MAKDVFVVTQRGITKVFVHPSQSLFNTICWQNQLWAEWRCKTFEKQDVGKFLGRNFGLLIRRSRNKVHVLFGVCYSLNCTICSVNV